MGSGDGRGDRDLLQPLGRYRAGLQGSQDQDDRPRLRRHRPQEDAQHPSGALPRTRRRTGVRAGCRERRAVRRRGSDHRVRRRQFAHPQQIRRHIPARYGRSAEPLCLARHEQTVRRLHLRFPAHRTWLVPGAHLSLRRKHLDLHCRDHR
ncbi:hypothetical protein D9M70_566640 [compost metagenome]